MKPSGLLCRFVSIWFHWPEMVEGGGWRCARCGTPGQTQGELLGADDSINFWRLSEANKRLLLGQAEQRPEPAAIVRPGASGVLRGRFTKAVS